MSDVYATLTDADTALVEQIVERLELRAADPKWRAMLHTYLSELSMPDDAKVLEVGCGSGAVARILARWPGVAHVDAVRHATTFEHRRRRVALAMCDRISVLGWSRNATGTPRLVALRYQHTPPQSPVRYTRRKNIHDR